MPEIYASPGCTMILVQFSGEEDSCEKKGCGGCVNVFIKHAGTDERDHIMQYVKDEGRAVVDPAFELFLRMVAEGHNPASIRIEELGHGPN